jgi:L,D-transpeptidase catalytic domain
MFSQRIPSKRLAGVVSVAVALCLSAQLFAAPPAGTRVDARTPTPSRPAKAAPAIALKPGEYLWMPELAPAGPVVIVISLPEQLAYVYRNGVRIGVSTVSTGKPGYETPTGVFTILQKQREHYSNLYDNAPMPFMQRLTWDGVALHAGRIPGYPASHGCVRLPYAFSEKLFAATSHGMTVVIASEASHAPEVASPGWFAPVDPATGAPRGPIDAVDASGDVWMPERAPEGPLTLVLSTRDGTLVVLRNGVEIGRAAVQVIGEPMHGTHAYVLLEGAGESPNAVLPDHPALRWLAIPVPNARAPSEGDLRQALATGRIRISDAFAHRVYEALRPGATVVVTDESIQRAAPSDGLTVLRADETAVAPEPPPPPQARPPAE